MRSLDANLSSDKLRQLEVECRYFHRLMFKRKPNDGFVENYIDAHALLAELNEFPLYQQQTVDKVVDYKINALAIEPWLRTKTKRHPLSSKLLLVAAIAECDGQHAEFQRKSRGMYLGWLNIFFVGLTAALKLIQGLLLVKMYGLV